MAEQYNFQSKNFLPNLNTDKWQLVDAVLNADYTVSISPGGYISCVISDLKDKTFMMYKTILDVTCADINSESNFNSRAGINMCTVYVNSNNEIDFTQNKFIGINTFDVVDIATNRYKDTNIFSSANKKIYYSDFVIYNSTDEVMIVHKAELYISEDINNEQLTSTMNQMFSSIGAKRVTFMLEPSTDDIIGLNVTRLNSVVDEWAFRFFGNRLAEVASNNGNHIIIDYAYKSSEPEE
jgi:hypothetical protein